MQAFVIATLSIVTSILEENFEGPDYLDVVSLVEIKSSVQINTCKVGTLLQKKFFQETELIYFVYILFLVISSAFILFVYLIL